MQIIRYYKYLIEKLQPKLPSDNYTIVTLNKNLAYLESVEITKTEIEIYQAESLTSNDFFPYIQLTLKNNSIDVELLSYNEFVRLENLNGLLDNMN